MLNNCGRPCMGFYNFLDDQEDGYENIWECLDFPPKPEYESGQGVPYLCLYSVTPVPVDQNYQLRLHISEYIL